MKMLIRDQRGANMVEYMLLVGLVALLSIAAVRQFGYKVRSKADDQSTSVTNDIK